MYYLIVIHSASEKFKKYKLKVKVRAIKNNTTTFV